MFGFINDEIIGAVVRRREPLAPPMLTASERNVRVTEKIYPHEAPEPPRQGDVPSRAAKLAIATFQNLAGIHSVMQDEFGYDLWAPVHNASANYWLGGYSDAVNPWNERVNIRREPSQPYGSMFELSTDEKYSLLMGR